MWTIYGIDSPNVDNVTNPKHIIIGDFRPTSNISEADFNNASYNFLYISGDTTIPVDPVQTSMSQYVNYTGSNILQYNRFNILHRSVVEGTHIDQYTYDGCAYTWTFNTPGSAVYFFNGYVEKSLRFSHAPDNIFASQGLQLQKDRVLSMRLVATTNAKGGIGVVRELWQADFTGVSGFSKAETQWWLGKVVPDDVIQKWVDKPDEKIDENKPQKPMLDPEEADQHSATTTGFTWLNKFKVMDWTADAWPERYLLDNKFYTDSEPFTKYIAYNTANDPDNKYHVNSGVGSIDPIRYIQKNINDEISEWGSDIGRYVDGGTDKGYFTTNNNDIDNFPTPVVYNDMRLTFELDIGDLKIDYTHQTSPYAPSNITHIRFYTGSKYFSIISNYTLNNTSWSDSIDLSEPHGFGHGACIVRRNGNYYLACIYRYGNWAGFAVYGQITNLKSLSNFDDGNPGDPKTPDPDTYPDADPDGVNPVDMNNTFGDGTGLEPNPTTESDINDKIGDAPASENDGSAFNPDGTPRNPADYDTPGSTGEKNTNPVDTHDVPNSHDGSLGNGTGDVHEGDTIINIYNLPSGTTSPGTVGGAGMLTVFTPSQAELNSFSAELLSPTTLDSIKNYFSTNPMDGIFGLHMIPFTGFDGTTTANPCIGTKVFTTALTLATDEYIEIDYGTVEIPFAYDGYENYAPYSDAKLFLPFLGTKDIDINIIQGCSCQLFYRVSLVTGDIYAYMYCTWISKWGDFGNPQGTSHLVYSWQGNCAATIPLSHLDSTNYISGAMQIAGGITSLVAGAAANPIAIPAGLAGVTKGVAEVGRTSIVTSGNISGMSAFMGCRTPYFILSRPIMAWNNSYNHYVGLRSNAIEKIGNLRDGTFTVMRNVDLVGLAATSEEISEINSIMQGGFYI